MGEMSVALIIIVSSRVFNVYIKGCHKYPIYCYISTTMSVKRDRIVLPCLATAHSPSVLYTRFGQSTVMIIIVAFFETSSQGPLRVVRRYNCGWLCCYI
jgi:hypothetical protein